MKHLTHPALFALLLVPTAFFAQSLTVAGSDNIQTLFPVDAVATDLSSVFILYGDGYFAFTTGAPIQTRTHKYAATGTYAADAYFAKKKKSSPPAKVTVPVVISSTTTIPWPTPPVAMGGAEIKIGTSWLPVADQQHFTILTIANQTGSAYSGNIALYFDANQSLLPADMIVNPAWGSGATISSPTGYAGFSSMVTMAFSSIPPGKQRHFYFFTKTGLGAAPGTPINSMAVMTKNGQADAPPTVAAFSVKNNKFAHDPNTKNVFPEEICPWQQPQKLDYSISFQNDGENFADDVLVHDIFNDQLDAQTFSQADASHPYTYSSAGQDFSFEFYGIKLPGLNQQWPEQYTYDQTIAWFDFNIETLPNLPPGVIPNCAEITFIGQPSIWTNTVKTIVLPEKECDGHGNPMGEGHDEDRDRGDRSANFLGEQPERIAAQPNPFSELLEIQLPDHLMTGSPVVEIFNLQGRKMAAQPVPDDGRAQFDATGWPSGVYFARYRSDNGNGAIRIAKH